ncbi:helix-turn-helix domain-containing protein [Burkholderia sp. Bp8990]|uniref:helix-turn-helix domain-containing protein n=1 Tax=Burkholderia sp. Bp8990 TaxID=2184552 RepID=UPI000F5902A1|nr:helix-turn-helix domain-containing protein [Burkholderia sp. Bp8990]RQS39748.1 DNA-binding protein [Burkholderia sp. Bp8990]
MLTTKQVAEILGCNEQRVCALAAQGRIKGARKFSKVWAFPNTIEITVREKGPELKVVKKLEQKR